MNLQSLSFHQLMRQIDLMVSAKKVEWENHMHAVQIQLDKKTKELEFVKSQLEHKSQEVPSMQVFTFKV